MLVSCHYRNYFSYAGFAELPLSVTVPQNQYALFRCRHERSDAIISWLLDGKPDNRLSDVVTDFISDSNETIVDTLTVLAIPIYDGSVVVCGAAFFDGSPSDTTPPVTLTITGQLHSLYILLSVSNISSLISLLINVILSYMSVLQHNNYYAVDDFLMR